MLKPLLTSLFFLLILTNLCSQNTVQSITIEPNNVSGGGFQSDVTITEDGQTVYSSADVAGIFKSTDGGLKFETINKGLKSPKVATLAITSDNDQILYAGTGDKGGSGGLFRSIDGGNTWLLTGAGNSAQFAGNHSADADPVPNGHPRSNGNLIVIDKGTNTAAFSDDIVIAGTYKNGVHVFTGGGEVAAGAVTTSGFVRSVARDDAIPNKAYAAIYIDVNSLLNGIYEIDYSDLSNIQSTLVYEATNPEGLTVLSNGHIYAAIGDDGIVKFNGTSWFLVNTGLDTGNNLRQWTAVTGYVWGSNDIVYAGLNNLGGNSNGAKYSSIWRTANGGTTWTPLVNVDTNVNHTIYGQTYNWWFSTDAFPPATIGHTNSVVSSIEVARGPQINNLTDDIIYVSGRGGIWKSDNGGGNWNPAVHNMAVTANEGVAVNANNPKQVMIANTDFVVLETSNSFLGDNISRDKPSGSESRAYDAIFDVEADQLILGVGDRDKNTPGGGEVYLKATDVLGKKNIAWTNTNLRLATLANNGRVRAVTYGYHDGNSSTTQTILAAVEGEGIYRYHEGTWSKSNGVTITNTKRSNMIWPDNTNSGVVYLLDLDQGMYRSNDGGKNWTDIWPTMNFNNNDFFNTGYLTADDNNPTTVYVSIQGRNGSPINTNFKVYRITGADSGILENPGTSGITDITKHSGNSIIQRPGPIVFGPDGRLWLTQQQNSVNNIFAGLFVMENPKTDTSFVNVTNQEYQNSVIQPSGIDVTSDGNIYISQNGSGVVKIEVQESGGPMNNAPISDAGLDQTVDANSLVTLDGSGSSDADGDELSYLWTAPNGITLSDATAINPKFIAPENNTTTTLTFSLVVNDGQVDSSADEVMITVIEASVENNAPVADAGLDQTVDANSLISLDGAGSSDADGDDLFYLWTAPNGITLSDAMAINPTFIAPENNTTTTLTFTLVVNDGQVNSSADEVVITVSENSIDCSQLELEVMITDESCVNEADGIISIIASGGVEPYEYQINGVTTSSFQEGNSAGNYSVKVTDATGCSKVIDKEIKTQVELSVDVVIQEKTAQLALSGGSTYFITINEEKIETSQESVSIPLTSNFNTLRVKTEKECQGIFTKEIILNDTMLLYPNPVTENYFNILNSFTDAVPMTVELYTLDGKLLSQKTFNANQANYQFEVASLLSGVYLVKISTSKEEFMERIYINRN